jgi:pSer/pThr/pTyr-binding forkhead associated (FHA) protein
LKGAPKAPAKTRRFWLEHAGQNIELRRGRLVVGRSSGCHLVLEDSMVSRRHAELIVADDNVTVQDLGSVNGIYVNSRRVQNSQRMVDGDRLQVGQREFVLHSVVRESMPSSGDRPMAETLHGESRVAAVESEDKTHVGDVFDVLGSVADKVLALERGDEAERILSGVLLAVLREAETSHDLAPQVAERAATYAVRIASATGRPNWLDYTVDLYAKLRRVLPMPVVDLLYDVVRRARGMNVTALRAYVEDLQQISRELGPSDRFVLQRLEGLERVVLS